MRAHLLAIAFIVVTTALPPSFRAQSITLLADQPHQLPFQLASGYLIVVQGSIGDSGRLNFIIDTGTTRTCIDQRLARQLSLPREAQSVLLRFGKIVRVGTTHLSSFTLGPLQAKKFTVNVADLSWVEKSGIQIAAIVGLDLLEPFPLQIDYEQKRLVFGPLQDLAESASMDFIPGLPVVSLDVNGSKSRLLIDTAARNLLFYSERVRANYNLKPGGRETWADSIGGVLEGRKAVPQGTACGPVRRCHEVYLIHAPSDGPLSSTDGILSPVAFGIRRIGFDFNRHVVTWAR